MAMINEEELEVPPGFAPLPHPHPDISSTTAVATTAAAFFSGCKSGLIEPDSVPVQHSTGCMHRCPSSANYNCMERKRKSSDVVTRRFPLPRRPRAAEDHPEMHTGSHNKVSSLQSPQVQVPELEPEPEPCSIPSFQNAAECPNSQANTHLREKSSEINISPSSDHRARRSTRMKGRTHDIAIDNSQTSGSHKSGFNTHDGEEMIIGTSSTKVLFPATGHRRMRNAGQNNHPSQRIDPSILKHLKNVLQHTPSLDEKSVKTRSSNKKKPSDVQPPIQAGLRSQFYFDPTITAIKAKYGCIDKDCNLKSGWMRKLNLFGICNMLKELQEKKFEELGIGSLEPYYEVVRDAEKLKINVKWLHQRLDEIKAAITSKDEVKILEDKKNEHVKKMEDKKKELKRLKIEIEKLEGQVALENLTIEELNDDISSRTPKFRHFQHHPLMDGLI